MYPIFICEFTPYSKNHGNYKLLIYYTYPLLHRYELSFPIPHWHLTYHVAWNDCFKCNKKHSFVSYPYLGTQTGLEPFSSHSSSGWCCKGRVLVLCKVKRMSFIAASTSLDFSPCTIRWGAGAGGGGVFSTNL